MKCEPLVVGLGDPGMTPLLRAGLGGLAASLRALLLRCDPTANWPQPVELGGAEARVEPKRITIDWNAALPDEVLRTLFDGSMGFDSYGLIELVGARGPDRPVDPALDAELQSGLKRTFLQHGPVTTGKAERAVVVAEIIGEMRALNIARYSKLVHKEKGPGLVGRALREGSVELASWVYPGAVERHAGLTATSCEYSAGQALAALFAIVGCLSFNVPQSGGAGVLIIVEPSDLSAFAVTRPRLTPRRLVDTAVTGPSDGVLAVHLALNVKELARVQRGVAAVHGVELKKVAWSPKQRTRTRTVSSTSVSDKRLKAYAELVDSLPNRLQVVRATIDDVADDFYIIGSALRRLVAENILARRPWFAGFATATVEQPNKHRMERRFIHAYLSDRTSPGALRRQEQGGLIAMLKDLEEAEAVLVRAVHGALRQRFAAIADESNEAPETMKNRFKRERTRWRLAFAGAKTPQQIRGALADLWSLAGPNRELRAHWEMVLPLLRADRWATARDLALVALASYRRAALEDDDDRVVGAEDSSRDGFIR